MTKEMIQQAQDRKFSDFNDTTKEVLAQKVAQALAEKGYYDRLDQARGIVKETKEVTED